MKLALLWTDIFYIAYTLVGVYILYKLIKQKKVDGIWRLVQNRIVGASCIVLYIAIGLLDSVHFQSLMGSVDGTIDYTHKLTSSLDMLLKSRANFHERTYSGLLQTLSLHQILLKMSGYIKNYNMYSL